MFAYNVCVAACMTRMYEYIQHVCNVRVNDHIAHHLQDDLAERFPALDLFFFIKFDALCTANHFIEGSFSNKGSLLRDNISDERLDRKARYRQNESHPIVKQVIAA